MPQIHIPRTDGEHSRAAKLTWNHVRHLRAAYARRRTREPVHTWARSWAAMFGVTPFAIVAIVKRRTWIETHAEGGE